MKAKLIVTDSYFNIFPLLTESLKGKTNDLTRKNFVFCEEKLSLMAERRICDAFGGTFNTEVYSFGNFLRARKKIAGTLSKEGSAMTVKKILTETPLKCFNRGKGNLAPSLFELISQLKSAKVSAADVHRAAEQTEGVLSAKLYDVAEVFAAYENYLEEYGLSDQSSALSWLPEIIENDADIVGADVYIAGFGGFTVQIRKVIAALIEKAASVTAVLTGGENGFAFVNETAAIFKKVCAECGAVCETKFVASDYSVGGAIIKDGLFNPLYKPTGKKPQVYFLAAAGAFSETDRIAEAIKRKILCGECRYRDFTVIVPAGTEYEEAIARSFKRLDVPYFLDVKRKPENFPAVSLLYAYADGFIRGLKIPVLASFFKNPYVCDDKNFTDGFENYLYKYDISYDKFRKPFVFPTESGDENELKEYENFRAFIASFFNRFDVETLFEKVGAEKKNEKLSERLKAAGEKEDAEINTQAFSKVKDLIAEMKFVLSGAKLDPAEFRSVFSSGVSAMEISVIPQYNDAVFVGDFKQAALAKAKYVFAAGLTDGVPGFQEDVALLTDADIDALAEIKVMVEPKINVVNHRRREEAALGLSAFDKGLYLSYPLSDFSGEQTVKSEILTYAAKFFEFKEFPPYDGYITKAQGMRSFARDCNRFASLISEDFSVPAAFYAATDGEPEKVANFANKEIKVKLNGKTGVLLRGVASPTEIEDYYSCPYRSFVSHVLKVRERDTGKMDALSVGKLMHEIFKSYIARVEEATDKAASDALFDSVARKVLSDAEFARYDEGENAFGLQLALKECAKYCYKMSRWYASSAFKPDGKDLEVRFGDDKNGIKARYPAVELLGGEVKLSGKIDRIDTYGKYFRVIDYKTGNTDTGDAAIFAGVKLQLYLYSLAITDKTLAGAYYLRVNDEYKSADGKGEPLADGKTANDAELFRAEEKEFIPTSGKKTISLNTLSAIRQYVGLMAKKAAEQMKEGVIVPSPYEGACNFCEYAALCGGGLAERKVTGVDADFIAQCVAAENTVNSTDTGSVAANEPKNVEVKAEKV
ncbi:MAG: PD-(D/E)XK nuclease family protein [Clostridia bacterium]|nr:PD-(D/E)XK nuclease family protein [Clostridia bacterium]